MNRNNFQQQNGKRFVPFLGPVSLNPAYSLDHIYETPPSSVSPQAVPGASTFIFPPVTQDAMPMISTATLSALHRQNCAILTALRLGGQDSGCPNSASSYLEQWQQHSYLLQLRHQQQLQLQQHFQLQKLAATALEQQHSALAASRGNQQSNEISAALKVIAMKAAEADPVTHNISREKIMEEFDCNGHTCEYDGCATQNDTTFKGPINSNKNIWGAATAVSAAFPQPTLQQGPLFNRHLTEMCQNIWKIVPMPTQVVPTAANTITASSEKNFNQKQSKRTSTAKTDKYLSVKHCVFCENNNEPEAVVKSHAVRDKMGRVLCPKLRIYICPICKASGDKAHTVKYCPNKPIVTMEQALAMESFRLTKIPSKNQIKSDI